MNKETLNRLKELAKKASRGDWICAHNPWSGFDASFACVGPSIRKTPPLHTLTDIINLHTMHRFPVCVIPGAFPISEKTNPLIEEQRCNASYITAAQPETILALINELEKLEKEANWLAGQLISKDNCVRVGGFLLDNRTVSEWRDAARNAVKDDANA